MSEHTEMTREQIFQKVVEILSDTFDLRREQITPQALLVQDLDLDSIDAVDLVVKLQQYTNRKIAPETFKKVRTINDVVEALLLLTHDGGSQGT